MAAASSYFPPTSLNACAARSITACGATSWARGRTATLSTNCGSGCASGADPRVVITTTPRNTDVIRELFKRKNNDVHLTHGRTDDNAEHLSPRVLEQLTERYAGTRLGRQELDAELLEDTEGALWSRAQIDKHRVQEAPGSETRHRRRRSCTVKRRDRRTKPASSRPRAAWMDCFMCWRIGRAATRPMRGASAP